MEPLPTTALLKTVDCLVEDELLDVLEVVVLVLPPLVVVVLVVLELLLELWNVVTLYSCTV